MPAMRVRNRVHGKRRARQRQEKKNNELEPNYASHEVASVWGSCPSIALARFSVRVPVF